jgi:hypothetical protein
MIRASLEMYFLVHDNPRAEEMLQHALDDPSPKSEIRCGTRKTNSIRQKE